MRVSFHIKKNSTTDLVAMKISAAGSLLALCSSPSLPPFLSLLVYQT